LRNFKNGEIVNLKNTSIGKISIKLEEENDRTIMAINNLLSKLNPNV
jgi:hypothetical protein